MKIWLVTVGEPLPIDGPGERLHRAGIFSTYLRKAGHDVVWWSSSFDHVRKKHRVDQYAAMTLDNGIDLRLLRGCGYRRNISFERIRDHRQIASQFASLAPAEQRPDVIVASFPTIELAREAVRYGKKYGVPVVVDVRDLWPEIFVQVAPRVLHPVVNLALSPLWREARAALAEAYAVTGNSPAFVQWGCAQGRRAMSGLDRYFPFGYASAAASSEQEALAYWKGLGVGLDESEFVACFFGAFSGQFDFETVIDAARKLESGGQKFKFVLCGTGERLEHVKAYARGLESVVFPGWVGQSEIWALMKLSHAGLAPYQNHTGFTGNLPNKPIEYMAGGVPVVSCLNGYLREFLAANECGLFYGPGNAAELCSALLGLAADPVGRRALSEKARKVFSGQFDADAVYGKMVDYLSEVSSTYRRGAQA